MFGLIFFLYSVIYFMAVYGLCCSGNHLFSFLMSFELLFALNGAFFLCADLFHGSFFGQFCAVVLLPIAGTEAVIGLLFLLRGRFKFRMGAVRSTGHLRG